MLVCINSLQSLTWTSVDRVACVSNAVAVTIHQIPNKKLHAAPNGVPIVWHDELLQPRTAREIQRASCASATQLESSHSPMQNKKAIMHSVQERPAACHPACNYKSAAHRGLENARTRSRHPKTQKQHATNQPAPARVLTPRQGQRHPTRISNRTRHRARPRGAGLSIGRCAQAHNHGPS